MSENVARSNETARFPYGVNSAPEQKDRVPVPGPRSGYSLSSAFSRGAR